MDKPKRADVLKWMYAAGVRGDRAEWMRLWATNRIGHAVAEERWAAGRRFAAGIAKRDAEKEKAHGDL